MASVGGKQVKLLLVFGFAFLQCLGVEHWSVVRLAPVLNVV